MSILSTFSKLFEIDEKRSTAINLAMISQFISSALYKRGQIDSINADFQKAFDKIDHNILFQMLSNYCLSSSLI